MKPRKDVKIRVSLPPDVHDWLTGAQADYAEYHMTMDRLITRVVRYYMNQPEDALDYDDRRVCCGTDGTINPATGGPRAGHRGTCRYSAMRGGATEYQALKRMWDRPVL